MAARLLRVLLAGLAVSCAGFANHGMAAIAPLSPSQLEDKAEEILQARFCRSLKRIAQQRVCTLSQSLLIALIQ